MVNDHQIARYKQALEKQTETNGINIDRINKNVLTTECEFEHLEKNHQVFPNLKRSGLVNEFVERIKMDDRLIPDLV